MEICIYINRCYTTEDPETKTTFLKKKPLYPKMNKMNFFEKVHSGSKRVKCVQPFYYNWLEVLKLGDWEPQRTLTGFGSGWLV